MYEGISFLLVCVVAMHTANRSSSILPRRDYNWFRRLYQRSDVNSDQRLHLVEFVMGIHAKDTVWITLQELYQRFLKVDEHFANKYTSYLYGLLDYNKDRAIHYTEYARVFQRFDQDEDGILSQTEFFRIFEQYFIDNPHQNYQLEHDK